MFPSLCTLLVDVPAEQNLAVENQLNTSRSAQGISHTHLDNYTPLGV
jgi:hypothetical protein